MKHKTVGFVGACALTVAMLAPGLALACPDSDKKAPQPPSLCPGDDTKTPSPPPSAH